MQSAAAMEVPPPSSSISTLIRRSAETAVLALRVADPASLCGPAPLVQSIDYINMNK
ncbi:unnamed protein product, partial [Onchocerca ochengi]|uniref:Uncharacterized protein n=1 Tax=Onchocerca ochengi TaxID=42157 RepID=A0A182ESC9_ONCOC